MKKRIFRFKVILNGIMPQVWRRIEVESDITFYQFHLILQWTMGWANAHLHEFSLGHFTISDKTEEMDGLGLDSSWDEKDKKLSNYFSKEITKIDYTYDFGDNWEHMIILEAIGPKEKGIKYPRCLDGARACPPEDCGSSPGYYRMLEILSDPEHDEYESMRDWAEDYDPEYFDKEEVTQCIRDPIDLSYIFK